MRRLARAACLSVICATCIGCETASDLAARDAQWRARSAAMEREIETLESANESLSAELLRLSDLRDRGADGVHENREIAVLEAANQALVRELDRVSDQRDHLKEHLDAFLTRYGELPGRERFPHPPPPPPVTRKITADIIEIRIDDDDSVIVRIDAGERDGLREGSVLTIGDRDGNYVGKLRVTKVDSDEAVGLATTPYGEPADVEAGDRAFAFAH